jgi:hypothetical protein
MAKLALSVDDRVVSRAKQYAKRRGVSVSEMVVAYLAAVAEPPSRAPGATPILGSVRGILKISMKRILFDTDIILDVLLDRKGRWRLTPSRPSIIWFKKRWAPAKPDECSQQS